MEDIALLKETIKAYFDRLGDALSATLKETTTVRPPLLLTPSLDFLS